MSRSKSNVIVTVLALGGRQRKSLLALLAALSQRVRFLMSSFGRFGAVPIRKAGSVTTGIRLANRVDERINVDMNCALQKDLIYANGVDVNIRNTFYLCSFRCNPIASFIVRK